MGTGGVPTRGYDPGNRKIWWKSSSGSTYVDFWLPNGEKLATFLLEETPVYDVNNTYFLGYVQLRATQRELYFAGRRVATQWGNTNSFTWLQPDRLSSNARHHPYGEERGTSSTEYKFATYQREASGLDYALNRYYSSVYGRFLSSDPYRASGGPSDPGSWNRYAYVQGDPVNLTDHRGLVIDDGCLINVCQIDFNGNDLDQLGIGGGGGACFDSLGFLISINPLCLGLGAGTSLPLGARAEPECGIELGTVPAVLGQRHSFLRITTTGDYAGLGTGTTILEGVDQRTSDSGVTDAPRGLNRRTKYLNARKYGDQGTIDADYRAAPAKSISGGLSNANCATVAKLMDRFGSYKNWSVEYHAAAGPNSNSFVHWLLNGVSELSSVAAPSGAWGWNDGTKIPF